MQVLYTGRICWFCGGRKTKVLGEKPSDQGENQQQTQLTHGTGAEYNPAILVEGERSQLTTFPVPYILVLYKFGFNTDTKWKAFGETTFRFKKLNISKT